MKTTIKKLKAGDKFRLDLKSPKGRDLFELLATGEKRCNVKNTRTNEIFITDKNKEVYSIKEDKKAKIKAGDLFYTSWGYDQTNYDYIIVESVSKTGKTVKCRRSSHEHMGNSYGCDHQKPIKKAFGDPFQLNVREGYSGDGVMLRGSYPFLHTGEIKVDEWGKHGMRLDSFSPVEEGRVYDETDSYSGH